MRRKSSVWPLAAAIIAVGGLAALGWNYLGGDRIVAQNGPTSTSTQAVIDLQNAFQSVAKTVRPAVAVERMAASCAVRPCASSSR